MTAPFLWEPWPPTGFDSVPAVLYRVGSPIDPHHATRQLSGAEQEALTYRWLPRTWTARRRYVMDAAIEEPRDLDRPPHLRPALVRALAMSRFCTGGMIFERLDDLGSPLAQAVILRLALQYAGLPVPNKQTVAEFNASPPAATLTVGYLGISKGRRQALRSEHSLLARHGASLQARIRSAQQHDDAAVAEGTHLLKQAMDSVSVLRKDGVSWGALATRSLIFPDLTFSGARAYLQRLGEQSVPDDRVEELLNLFGFINSKGHRTWHGAELRRVRQESGGSM